MTVKIGDRILVSTTTPGTGTYYLGSAVTGYNTFIGTSGIVTGDDVAYVVVDSLSSPTAWEICHGTITTGTPPSLSRSVIASSNSNNPVNWPNSSSKWIFSAPSRKHLLVFDDVSDLAAVRTALGIGTGSTVNFGALQIAGTTRIAADGQITGTNVNATDAFIVSGAAGSSRLFRIRTSGVDRFIVGCNNGAETGANAGSDFFINSHDDAGSLINTVLDINRATGSFNVSTGPLKVASQEIATTAGHLKIRSYTVGTLPSASTAQQLIYVSNGTSNKRLAVSDGTNWRWPDGAIVS